MQKEEIKKKEEINRLSASQIALKTLKHWPWLILSLIIWFALAFIYLKVKAPTYMRTAKILITDESGKNSFSLPSAAMSFGMFGSNQVLLDEIVKMESPDVMETVIKRLNLDVIFEQPGEFHREQVYGDTIPLTVIAPTWSDDDYVKMTIDIARNGDVYLSNIKLNSKKFDFEQQGPGRLGHPIKTPAGYVTVSSTPSFKKGREYTLYMEKIPVNDAIKRYSKTTKILQDDDQSNAVGITVYDRSPGRAVDIINSIIDVYNENWANHKNSIKDVTTRFIDERLANIERDLGSVDKNISNFQSENQMPDLEKAAAIYLTDNQMADQQLLELTNQVKVARYMRNYMDGAAHTNEVLPTFTSLGVGTSALERQITEYNEKLMERNRLVSNSSTNHPMIVTLDEQLDQMRAAIINSTNNEIASLNTQIENVLTKKTQVENKISRAPIQANTLLESGRQQKVLESLYVFLLQKREENEMNQAYGLLNTQVIAKPRGEKKPAKPRKPLIFAVAFFMGLMTPYCLTYIFEILNTKVNDKKDLDILSVPLLGEIPQWRKDKKEIKDRKTGEPVVVKKDSNDIINDAFRILRTNVLFQTRKSKDIGDEGGNVLMLTSLSPGNGKSFISINLTTSLALAGKKAILIDGDLRHGTASEYAGNPKQGLSDFLVGEVEDWRHLVTTDDALHGANLMPIGQFLTNPSELLESDRFEKMIREMKSDYDFIIIDCPSVKAMADAKIIEKVADRSIFVIRAGVFKRADLPEIENIYNDKTFKNMSVILNGVKTSKSDLSSKTPSNKSRQNA